MVRVKCEAKKNLEGTGMMEFRIPMVFAYINSLALIVKHVTDWVLNRYVFKGGGNLAAN